MSNFIKFLKPNKKKIVLFVLLLFLISILTYLAFKNLPKEFLEIPSSGSNWLSGCFLEEINLLFLPSVYISSCDFNTGFSPLILLFLRYWMIILYFISCFIFYLYEKFKPKKL